MDTSWVGNLTRSLRWGSVAALVAVGISSCDDATDPSQGFGADVYLFDLEAMITADECYPLIAGQHTDAGEVCVSVDNIPDELTVTYTTSGEWKMSEVHLWVGLSLADMPQTQNGSPKIGHFPYKYEDPSGFTFYEFTVDLSSLGAAGEVCAEEFLLLAAHAALHNGDREETGWGQGKRFVQQGTWATYFEVPITCDEVPPPPGSETAFAYGGDYATCFLDKTFGGQSFSRWGWTNGPLPPDDYVFDIYAAAGQCDLIKGTLVGTLTVLYDGTEADVTYTVNPPYGLGETHLYVGEEPLPQKSNGDFTVAPGQYPFSDADATGDGTTREYTGVLPVCDGACPPEGIYVVAHAVVSGFGGP